MARIRVSANGLYFVDEQGEPFFWLGDTLWELFRLATTDDARAMLKRRREQGFSAIQIMMTGVGDGTEPDLDGQKPWIGDDPAHPNEAYFRRVDPVIEAAGSLGLTLVVGIYHQRQREHITTDNARSYARWAAERYRDAPHVVWTMYPEAKAEYVPVLRELAAGIKEGEGGTHLITVHPDPSPTSSSFIHQEEWLDFNMSQPCVEYELIHKMVSYDYARTPPKPAVMAEGGYEGEEFGRTQTALEIRQQAYWSYLAGGHHSYGHNDNWASPGTWRDWIDSPGARSLTVCRRILTGLHEWWRLVPDQSLLAAGEGEGLTLNVAARHEAGDWCFVYLSSPSEVSLRMDGACGGHAADACWIDPTTGQRTGLGDVEGSGIRAFATPDGWYDALLLLQKRSGS